MPFSFTTYLTGMVSNPLLSSAKKPSLKTIVSLDKMMTIAFTIDLSHLHRALRSIVTIYTEFDGSFSDAGGPPAVNRLQIKLAREKEDMNEMEKKNEGEKSCGKLTLDRAIPPPRARELSNTHQNCDEGPLMKQYYMVSLLSMVSSLSSLNVGRLSLCWINASALKPKCGLVNQANGYMTFCVGIFIDPITHQFENAVAKGTGTGAVKYLWLHKNIVCICCCLHFKKKEHVPTLEAKDRSDIVLIGQSASIHDEAGKFINYFIPALFAFAILQPLIRYIQINHQGIILAKVAELKKKQQLAKETDEKEHELVVDRRV
ncbi:hypothetical protein Tco_1500346 [Tanacetum coccineum]